MHVYTILVVDDEEDMRNLVEMYLLNSGYRCLQAANGKEAISMVETEEVDLILLDIMILKVWMVSPFVKKFVKIGRFL